METLTKRETLFKQLQTYKKDLEGKGYHVLYIGLYGSQNYELSDDNSDIDARAVVLPTISQIVKNKGISVTLEYPTGQVDVKDVFTFLNVLQKGNIAFIEAVRTPVFIGNKRLHEEMQIYKVKPMSVYGMIMEKIKAIEKGLPASSPFIEKIGYDPKQYHHILRLTDLIGVLSNGVDVPYIVYGESNREELMRIKRIGVGTKEEVLAAANTMAKTVLSLIATMEPFETQEIPQSTYDLIEELMVERLFKPNKQFAARAERTFNQNIPNRDLKDFPILEDYKGKDISYVVYSYLEFLGESGDSSN